MKRMAIMLYLSSVLSACAANEASSTDRNFALAQSTMQKQIINLAPRDLPYPEGMQSMDAERMMQTWSKTYDPPMHENRRRYELSVESK